MRTQHTDYDKAHRWHVIITLQQASCLARAEAPLVCLRVNGHKRRRLFSFQCCKHRRIDFRIGLACQIVHWSPAKVNNPVPGKLQSRRFQTSVNDPHAYTRCDLIRLSSDASISSLTKTAQWFTSTQIRPPMRIYGRKEW